MPALVVALCLFLAAAAGPLVALARPPAAGGVMLVVAPDAGRAALIAAAGARPVGPAEAPLATLAVAAGPAGDAGADPGVARRLRAAGAWLVLDGTVLARLCGVAP